MDNASSQGYDVFVISGDILELTEDYEGLPAGTQLEVGGGHAVFYREAYVKLVQHPLVIKWVPLRLCRMVTPIAQHFPGVSDSGADGYSLVIKLPDGNVIRTQALQRFIFAALARFEQDAHWPDGWWVVGLYHSYDEAHTRSSQCIDKVVSVREVQVLALEQED